MWKLLWDDFLSRTERLVRTSVAQDAVDETLLWQLRGHAEHVGAPIGPSALQLPELYSGCPWLHSERWIAFLTLNPSIDATEVYPTVSTYRELGASDHLISFFERRFHERREEPLRHGRPLGANRLPTSWKRATAARNIKASRNQTWTKLDNLLRDSWGAHRYPLGEVGAIVDVVPWKFKKWSTASPATRLQLIASARPYLEWWLSEYRPSLLVVMGNDAWSALSQIHREVGTSSTLVDGIQRRVLERSSGGGAVHAIKMAFPTTQAFNQSREVLVSAITNALSR